MQIALNIISWFETISEDEVLTLKRLAMLFQLVFELFLLKRGGLKIGTAYNLYINYSSVSS